MTQRVVIVDDEAIARRKLRRLLSEQRGAEIVAEAGTGDAAVAAIEAQRPDMVFLDIQMPGGDGFSVVQRIGAQAMPPTVFVTAYDQHAIRAFQVSAVDYILKPVTSERVRDAYARAAQRMSHEQMRRELTSLMSALHELTQRNASSQAASVEWLEWFVVPGSRGSRMLAVDQVDWIEAAGNYVRLHARGQTYLYRESLTALSARLSPMQFMRVHRSSIVQLSRIRTINSWFGGDQILELEGGGQVKLSRNYRKAFEQRIQKLPVDQ